MSRSTLLLNASYEPLSVVSAQRAVTLITLDRAVSLDDSPITFRANGVEINVPYVAILRRQVKKSVNHRPAKFSRRGVLVRDEFTCVYCGSYGDTIDHVLPRAKGGTSTYENCVTACSPCNRKKSDRTLEQMGWTLPRDPVAPSLYEHLLNKARGNDEQYASWEEFIGYYLPKKNRIKVTS